MASKWKKRYMQIRESSMCRHVYPHLEVQPDGTVRAVFRHICGYDCEYLQAVLGDG